MEQTPKDKDMFRSIGELADGEEMDGLSIIPGSLCMECGESGDTRMMTTRIPFFREIILCSFECDSCHSTNNEVTFGGEIQEKGVKYVLEVKNKLDMNRSVIKADTATVIVPSLDFEIPARSQKGGITTVEGLISKAIENLSYYQPERMVSDPVTGAGVALIIVRLKMLVDHDNDEAADDFTPFQLIIDDPSGNSFVENLCAPNNDPQLTITNYERSPMQDIAVGLQPSASVRDELDASNTFIDDNNVKHRAVTQSKFDGVHDMLNKYGEVVGSQTNESSSAAVTTTTTTSAAPEVVTIVEKKEKGEVKEASDNYVAYNEDGTPNLDEDVSSSLGRREIIRMPTNCPHCNIPGESLTCFADIPHFKEVIIMAFDCIGCGYRSNEVKGGGGVPRKGQLFSLQVNSAEDLGRDVLKSSSCDVIIPELEMEASQGSLGGIFTTVEGLLKKVHGAMLESTPYMMGDSAQDSSRKTEFKKFTDKFSAIAEGKHFPFTLQLRDPLANSFIGTLLDVDFEDDKALTITDYARTFDEDEELGLHDIDVGDDQDEEQIIGGDSGSLKTTTENADDGAPNPNRGIIHKRWGPDHPHNFAKGCDDATKYTPITEAASGEYETAERVGANQGTSTTQTTSYTESSTATMPVLVKICEDDNDFKNALKFTGKRDGFVFKNGEKGCGYYRDD